MRRNILITASTGHQGFALIHALQPLLYPPSLTPAHDANSNLIPDSEHEYHIFALTRNASSPSAKALAAISESIAIVEGDLDAPESISRIFNEVKAYYGGIWGVFACLPYPGLGRAADGEERQGKRLADMALKHGVECFVYSSSARAGPRFECEGPDEDARASWNGETLKLSQRAKSRVERHIVGLGDRGLAWT
jgi:nucleoside-diphosphate-sugar epimerase